MQNLRSRRRPARRSALGLVMATVGAGLALALTPALALAATTAPPTLVTSFTPAEIGVTETSGITYTLTDPNPSGSLSNVAFTDTLPSLATIDAPAGLTDSGCGSSPIFGVTPGNGEATAQSLTIKAGTPCVISFGVVGNTAGTGSDVISSFVYSTSATGASIAVPAANVTEGSLEVIAAPTATITGPRNGAVFAYGSKVPVQFSCSAPDDANGSTLAGCLASDDLGNSYTSGQDLDTTDPGHHTLDVQAIENNGDTTDVTVDYTVLPDNAVKLTAAKAESKGRARLVLDVPGAGRIAIVARHGAKVIADEQLKLTGAHSARTVTLTPTAAGRKAIKAAAHGLSVKITVTFTPTGGRARSVSRTVTLRA